jgi:hypothetical protein
MSPNCDAGASHAWCVSHRPGSGKVAASLALLLALAACAVPASSSTHGSRGDSPGANRNTTGELKSPDIGDEQAVKRPPPEASNQPMPVIPPPGTPGGNPDLRPK